MTTTVPNLTREERSEISLATRKLQEGFGDWVEEVGPTKPPAWSYEKAVDEFATVLDANKLDGDMFRLLAVNWDAREYGFKLPG